MRDTTVGPLSHPAPVAPGAGTPRGRLARSAVALSASCGTLFVAAVAATAAGVGGGVAAVAFVGSFAGFVLAVVARIRHERWAWLWLPLCVFPAMTLCLPLVEALWWE